jgi:hypothetical protein
VNQKEYISTPPAHDKLALNFLSTGTLVTEVKKPQFKSHCLLETEKTIHTKMEKAAVKSEGLVIPVLLPHLPCAASLY